jgi:hypothetical protein
MQSVGTSSSKRAVGVAAKAPATDKSAPKPKYKMVDDHKAEKQGAADLAQSKNSPPHQPRPAYPSAHNEAPARGSPAHALPPSPPSPRGAPARTDPSSQRVDRAGQGGDKHDDGGQARSSSSADRKTLHKPSAPAAKETEAQLRNQRSANPKHMQFGPGDVDAAGRFDGGGSSRTGLQDSAAVGRGLVAHDQVSAADQPQKDEVGGEHGNLNQSGQMNEAASPEPVVQGGQASESTGAQTSGENPADEAQKGEAGDETAATVVEPTPMQVNDQDADGEAFTPEVEQVSTELNDQIQSIWHAKSAPVHTEQEFLKNWTSSDNKQPFANIDLVHPDASDYIDKFSVVYQSTAEKGKEPKTIPLKHAIERQLISPGGPYDKKTGSVYKNWSSSPVGRVKLKPELILDSKEALKLRNDLFYADLQSKASKTHKEVWKNIEQPLAVAVQKNIEALTSLDDPPMFYEPDVGLGYDPRGLRFNLERKNIPNSEWHKYEKVVKDTFDTQSGYIVPVDINGYKSEGHIVFNSGPDNTDKPMVLYDTVTGAMDPYENLDALRRGLMEHIATSSDPLDNDFQLTVSDFNKQDGVKNKGINSTLKEIHEDYKNGGELYKKKLMRHYLGKYWGVNEPGKALVKNFKKMQLDNIDRIFKSKSEARFDRVDSILRPVLGVVGSLLAFLPAPLNLVFLPLTAATAAYGSGVVQDSIKAVNGDNYDERRSGAIGAGSGLLGLVPLMFAGRVAESGVAKLISMAKNARPVGASELLFARSVGAAAFAPTMPQSKILPFIKKTYPTKGHPILAKVGKFIEDHKENSIYGASVALEEGASEAAEQEGEAILNKIIPTS